MILRAKMRRNVRGMGEKLHQKRGGAHRISDLLRFLDSDYNDGMGNEAGLPCLPIMDIWVDILDGMMDQECLYET